MLEITTNIEKILTDGGFRIEIKSDELTVTADKSAWKAHTSTAVSRIFSVLALIVFAVYGLSKVLENPGSAGFALLILTAIFGLSLLFNYLSGTNNLHCTRENIEVIRARRNKVIGKWLFSRSLVRQVRWAAVSYSRYGSTCAIVFNVEGKKVKTLRGIECPEAQTVLNELKRLGYDVEIDVGMPMMVDMALGRRDGHMLG